MRGVWSRVPVALIFLAILACLPDGKATWAPDDPEEDTCVNVKVFDKKLFLRKETPVAKCKFAESLGKAIESLQDKVTTLAENGKRAIAANKENIKDLQREVDELQGANTALTRLVYTDGNNDSRPFCQIYTFGEASEICKLLGFENPNPHFVHIHCEKPDGDRSQCFEQFWNLRQACFKPNDAPAGEPSPIFDCIDPPTGDDTCERPVWLGCEGYTTNLREEDWAGFDIHTLLSTCCSS